MVWWPARAPKWKQRSSGRHQCLTNDDYLYFKNVFENAGALHASSPFVNTTEDPPVERLLVPDMALTAAEYFAVERMKSAGAAHRYDPLRGRAEHRLQPDGPDPIQRQYAGSLYSDLAKLYENSSI